MVIDMPDQKGSLKDRIRSWILFLNYKKELKKRQKVEKQRIKMQKKQVQILASGRYYSKPKVFDLTILGLFFGLFENKEKKQIKSLEKSIDDLELKLSIDSFDNGILDEIKIIEQEIKNIKLSNNKKNIDINKYDKKLKDIKLKISQKQQETLTQVQDKKLLQSDYVSKKQPNNLSTEKYIGQKRLEKSKQKSGIYIPVLETKVFNKDLKKYNKKLAEINSKIKTTTNYNELYEYEFLIKQLKIKINELLIKYEGLKKYPGFEYLQDMIVVKDFDEFNLKIDNKRIKEILTLCETNLMIIENKKEEIIKSKKEKTKINAEKKEITKEEKTKVKKEEKQLEENEKNKLVELMLANKVISDSIVKEKRKIMRFNKQISNMSFKRRKHSVFYYTKNLISSIVNFSLSLFPISLFKNKMLGGLVSGIMINNSLRSVRKILKPDIEINYIYMDIDKEITKANKCLSKMMYVCDDSLRQINDIRNTIYKSYSGDIIYNESLVAYLDDLSKIESKILYEQSTILSMDENLKIVKEKSKQKVKK